MTVYTATPEMCHTTPDDYGMSRLPYDWPGKKFLLDLVGSDLIARLVIEETASSRRWTITEDLAQKIKASVETTEEVTPEGTQEMRDEIQRLRDIVVARERELSTFKRRVGEVAMEYAERHDWCDTVKEALDEIGVEVPTKEYEFTLSVIYRVRGTKESYGEPDSYDIQARAYLDPDVTMTLDDWGDFEVEYVQHDVMDLEEVQR